MFVRSDFCLNVEDGVESSSKVRSFYTLHESGSFGYGLDVGSEGVEVDGNEVGSDVRHSSNGTGNRIVCKSTGGWICGFVLR